MQININHNQIAHKRNFLSTFHQPQVVAISAKQLGGTCEYLGHLLGEAPISIEKIIRNVDTSRVQLLKELARKYNLRNAELPLIKRESKEGLFQIFESIKEPLPVHFDILRRIRDDFDSIKTIFDLATDEKSLEFVSNLQRETLRGEPNQTKTIIDILNSKHRSMYMDDIDQYKSYLKLNSENSKALEKLDSSIDNKRYDSNKYDSEFAVKKLMQFKTVGDFVKPFEKLLAKYYNPENGRFLWKLTNNFWYKKVSPEYIQKDEFLGLYKTTNKKNIALRLAILDNFKYSARKNEKTELKELDKLFKKIEKDSEVKKFVTNSVEQGLAVNTIGELNSVIDNTPLHKANYFFENVRRIVALSEGEERNKALINELENPFFKPKQQRNTRPWKVRDNVEEYGVFEKMQKFLSNKLKVFIYNKFKSKDAINDQTKINGLKIKKFTQDKKIQLAKEVNNIIKNKLDKRTYEAYEDNFRLKATKIRLSLLSDIFESIKVTRAQIRKQGGIPTISNKDASRLYELINGNNKKIVRYMLKKCDSEGNRIFDVKQIIDILEKTNSEIREAKKLRAGYKAADQKAYYNKIYNALIENYGKPERTRKTNA